MASKYLVIRSSRCIYKVSKTLTFRFIFVATMQSIVIDTIRFTASNCTDIEIHSYLLSLNKITVGKYLIISL